MIFKATIALPKSTTKASPVTEMLPIAHGIITKIMVRPRAGHRWLAHCVILHHEGQIAPSSGSMDFIGEFFPIDWEEYYEIRTAPYELKIVGWNDDDTFAHTFDIYVAILPRKAIMSLAIVDAIRSVFGMLSPKRIFTRGQ